MESLDELIPFDPRPERLDKRWNLEATREFLVLLAEFFGNPPRAEFQVIPGLLNGGASYGAGVVFPDHSEFISPIIGVYNWDDDGLPLFDASFVPTVVHEFVHSYTNPLVDDYWNDLEPSADRIFSHCKGLLELSAYGSSRILVYESLVRACVLLYMEASEDPNTVAMNKQRDIFRGFIWIEGLTELLARYEQERDKFPDFASFMPEIVAFFNAYADEYDLKMAQAPHVVSVVPDLSQPIGWDVDELVITFDRPMVTSSYSITSQGSAPDLENHVFSDDGKVLRMTMKVEAGASYSISLNSLNYRTFKSADGIVLDPYPLRIEVRSR